jgi:hypothetical protein
MGHTLAVLDAHIQRPHGVTPKQWRLAAIYPRAESAYQALIAAGYSPKNADRNAKRELGRVGLERATVALAKVRADKAKGILGIGNAALESAASLFDQMEPAHRIRLGLDAVKLAHEIGENLEMSGNADRWSQRIRRACRLMARLTEQRLRREQAPPAR